MGVVAGGSGYKSYIFLLPILPLKEGSRPAAKRQGHTRNGNWESKSRSSGALTVHYCPTSNTLEKSVESYHSRVITHIRYTTIRPVSTLKSSQQAHARTMSSAHRRVLRTAHHPMFIERGHHHSSPHPAAPQMHPSRSQPPTITHP